MRSRLVDFALIFGLAAVGAAILWTLFNLGASQPPVARPPVTREGAPQANPSPVTDPIPEVPTGVAEGPDVPPLARAEAPAPAEAQAPASVPSTATPRVLPEGVLALEQIGFSYVTGGPGACGMVLEAWLHVAVSRDLLASYGCGATVRVTLDDPAGGRSELEGVIGDTMSPSFNRTVNVYVGTDENAFRYGLTTGTFAAR